jgi:predicted nucleotidyltransferase component of viral defense system
VLILVGHCSLRSAELVLIRSQLNKPKATELICCGSPLIPLESDANNADSSGRVLMKPSQFTLWPPTERCAEKVRAFLTRSACRDAYDLWFFWERALTARQKDEIPALTLLKLRASRPSEIPAGTPLSTALDEASATAKAAWPQDVIVCMHPRLARPSQFGQYQTLTRRAEGPRTSLPRRSARA